MIQDFVVNVLASLFFGICGYYFGIMQRLFKTRKARVLWGPLLDRSQIGVVLTARNGPFPRNTQKVSLNETRAFAELSVLLQNFGSSVELLSSDTDVSSLKDKHLVLLGGPNANQVTDKAWQMIQKQGQLPVSLSRRFRQENEERSAQTIQIGNQTYHPEYDSAGYVIRDYGIILRTKNPFDNSRSKYLILAFGCHGHGTYAAVSSITQEKLITAIQRKAGSDDFVALVQVELQNHEIVKTSVLNSFNWRPD
jgi:hypothetical protein